MTSPAVREVRGRALPLRGNDIDTDRIIPARFLKTVSFEGLEAHVFEDDRRSTQAGGGQHPFSDSRYAGASVLLVGVNFGCGSSREHAPQALKRWGIGAVIGVSFSEIFFGNALALGLPCLAADGVERLMSLVEREPAVELVVDVVGLRASAGSESLELQMPAGAREALTSGTWDATHMLLDRYEEVQAVSRRLPYLGGFE